jgi:uncharacterized protein
VRIDLNKVLSFEDEKYKETVPFEQEMFKSKLGEYPITKKTPLSLEIRNVENRMLEITATMELTLSTTCDRCLEDVEVDMYVDILRELPIVEKQLVMQDMEDTEYIIGSSLETDELVYSELLMRWPMKILCRQDCKGLCNKCGNNLNQEECGCDRIELDPRMAAIKDIFNKFKEV